MIIQTLMTVNINDNVSNQTNEIQKQVDELFVMVKQLKNQISS